MHSAPTTRQMSPSELAECRENLKRQWENRRADKELLQRAWEVVHIALPLSFIKISVQRKSPSSVLSLNTERVHKSIGY